MIDVEYLSSYGRLGDFGRFRSVKPLTCRRGATVVVRSHRGLELAQVLGVAHPRHAHFLPNTTVGQLLRLAGPDDERTAAEMRGRAERLFARAGQLSAELQLPLEVLDAEVLLDGEHAVLHHLRGADCDVRPLVSTLSREFTLHLVLQDLTRQGVEEATSDEHEDHGCGREGCGGGNCGSCGSGGGCGTCGTTAPADLTAHFAGLREQMDKSRVPLL